MLGRTLAWTLFLSLCAPGAAWAGCVGETVSALHVLEQNSFTDCSDTELKTLRTACEGWLDTQTRDLRREKRGLERSLLLGYFGALKGSLALIAAEMAGRGL